jgi:acetyltransferase-like isoleucine patch superfamily enzyme
LNNPFFRIFILKDKGATIEIKGNLKVWDRMLLCKLMEISGLNGVRIDVSESAMLKIGGRDLESESGITCNSYIFAYNKIEIGKDFLCGSNVFVTDCNWHYIEYDGKPLFQDDVSIGDHVWSGNNRTILKRSQNRKRVYSWKSRIG